MSPPWPGTTVSVFLAALWKPRGIQKPATTTLPPQASLCGQKHSVKPEAPALSINDLQDVPRPGHRASKSFSSPWGQPLNPSVNGPLHTPPPRWKPESSPRLTSAKSQQPRRLALCSKPVIWVVLPGTSWKH